MNTLVIMNFRLALIVTVIGSVWFFLPLAQGYPGSLASPASNGVAALAELVLLPLFTLALWVWRYRAGEGHFAAFVVGFLVLAPAVGALAANAIHGEVYNSAQVWWRAYVGGAHLAYASLRAGAVLRALGADAR